MTSTTRRTTRARLILASAASTSICLLPAVTPGAAHAAAGTTSLGSATHAASAAGLPATGPVVARTRHGVGRFTHPLAVTNRFLPLVPGTRFRYEGRVSGEGPHVEVFTVSDLTLKIHGVSVVVVLDEDYRSGRLEEAELAFFAQDDAGDVWNLGEHPEEFENGHFTGAPSTWIDRVHKAAGGFKLPARPRLGQTWTEGRSAAIDFLDVSRVAKVRTTVRSGLGVHRGVLEVDETSPLDPTSGHQLKFYAPHIGLVRVEARGGDAQETLTLVRVSHLGRRAMADVRSTVRTMDRRGRTVSRDYRTVGPLRVRCS
jgi:hypothetical protein